MTRLHFSTCTTVVVVLLTAALPLPTSAQSTATTPTRVRAAINAVHSPAVDATDTSDNKAAVTLPADISVTQVVLIKPLAIRVGSYIGTAAVKEPGGTFRALEVHVFPEVTCDIGDDHHPYDLRSNSSMTNGTVEQTGVVTGAQGRALSVKYKDEEQRIMVSSQAPIVVFESGRRDDLKVGARVVMSVRVDAQGTLVV